MTTMQSSRFGQYGGQFVPETVMPSLLELEREYLRLMESSEFQQEFSRYLNEYAGRPTRLYYAANLTRHYGRGRIYLKREDLLHTGAHKINNALGQGLLARHMGKTRIVAETGAGQHGVASATVSALLGMNCTVYMGEEDIHRQALNVFRMKLLGAKVVPVTSGCGTLKDATSEAIRDWVTNINDTHYIIGSVVGPHPYPRIVRDFQAVIGDETRSQISELAGRLPDYVVACVGGGSNAMGMFYPFRDAPGVKLIGVEAAGKGLDTPDHAATLTYGRPGVLHGAYSYLLQDADGQVTPPYSISAGLDYPGVGPEHSHFRDSKIAAYTAVTDKQALAAFQLLARTEGIIPALESAHALAHLETLMPETKTEDIVVVCLSGRGDKDVQMVSGVMEGLA